jgi:hypothetical protein
MRSDNLMAPQQALEAGGVIFLDPAACLGLFLTFACAARSKMGNFD